MMHFVDPKHVADYRRGSTPQVIQQHEQVAAHYAIPSLNLAREITERMDSGQFDWKNDFRELPSLAVWAHRLCIFDSTNAIE